ncbi:MAG: serine/threonine protein kinase [Gammaproteobacteria bacterium]
MTDSTSNPNQLRRSLSGALGRASVTLKPLACGAVGYVCRLDCDADVDPLTVKILHGRHRRNQQLHGAMAREFALLDTLDHPRLPQTKDHGQWLDRSVISYRYIQGRPLLDLLAANEITPRLAIDLAVQLFDILTHLHEHRLCIVHGDISPENLLINDQQQLFLIDFGTAWASSIAHAGGQPGKPSYLSPEQAQGRTCTYRSDLYQSGIILFELLTGKRYNPGQSPIARRAFAASPEIDLDDFVSVPYRAVLRRLLDPEPMARWPTARSCLGALQRLQREPDLWSTGLTTNGAQ